MNYGEIKNADIANGHGVRVSLFVSGCTRHCKNCFNQMTWDFNYGEPFTKAVEDRIIDMLKPAYINGLTVLGGEPFEPSNQIALLPFLKRVKSTYPDKTIWCFTGSTLETDFTPGGRNYCEATNEILDMIDVLVDGAFIEELKNISLKFRGSENQRLIDMKKTRACNKVVLWEE